MGLCLLWEQGLGSGEGSVVLVGAQRVPECWRWSEGSREVLMGRLL